jgi:hypothetical protein
MPNTYQINDDNRKIANIEFKRKNKFLFSNGHKIEATLFTVDEYFETSPKIVLSGSEEMNLYLLQKQVEPYWFSLYAFR